MCSLTYPWVYSEKLEALNITIGEIRFCYLCFSVLNCVSPFPHCGSKASEKMALWATGSGFSDPHRGCVKSYPWSSWISFGIDM